jgi:serine/threonine-protein kinase RsbW
MIDTTQFTINSDLKNISSVIKELNDKWEEAGIDGQTIFSLRLALEEALANAVKHGNRCKKELLVDVTCRILSTSVELEVKDQGDGFNYEAVSDPTSQQAICKPGGRGILLMRKLMDTVIFGDGGSRILMTKVINVDLSDTKETN